MSRTYRGGVPAPPKHLAAAMAAAHDDEVRLGQLHARYLEWLEEQGYRQPTLGRPTRADEAAR